MFSSYIRTLGRRFLIHPLLGESWEIAHTDGKYSLVKFDAEKKELQKALLPDPKDNYLIEYDSSGVAMLKDDDKVKACQDVVEESSKEVAEGLFICNNATTIDQETNCSTGLGFTALINVDSCKKTIIFHHWFI